MRFVLKLVELVGLLPLSWVRAFGVLFGRVLYVAVPSRRKVVRTNLRLCFPTWSAQQLHRVTLETFIHFAQAWLDRG